MWMWTLLAVLIINQSTSSLVVEIMLRNLNGPCARPARLCSPVRCAVFIRRASPPHDQAAHAESASATAGSTAAAVCSDHSQSVQHDSPTAAAPDNRSPEKRDKKPKRKPSAPQSSTVMFEGAAAAAGALPDVLAATFPETFPTLSAARRVIRKDLILVGGHLGSCKTDVTVGQQLQQLEPVSKSKGPRVASLQVLYEDDDLAAVHKPWGVKMYGGDGRRTITGALKAGALKPSTAADALPEPKPLHRLDAAVGGVLLIAKTASAAADISLQFVERRVHKVYHALLCGYLVPGTAPNPAAVANTAVDSVQQQQQQQGGTASPEDEVTNDDDSARSETQSDTQSDTDDQQEGDSSQSLPLQELLQRQLQDTPAFTVTAQDLADPVLLSPAAAAAANNPDSPVSSSSSSSSSGQIADIAAAAAGLGEGVHVVDMPVEGRSSYSLYQVLGYSRSSRYGGWVTSVALSPVTGRKHQLRRHMAALGCPIVGDGKYALSKEEHISNQGIYLESLEIAFTHPSTQQRLHIKMPEPQRFGVMRQQLHNRWRKVSQQAAAADAAVESSAKPQAAAAAAAEGLDS